MQGFKLNVAKTVVYQSHEHTKASYIKVKIPAIKLQNEKGRNLYVHEMSLLVIRLSS